MKIPVYPIWKTYMCEFPMHNIITTTVILQNETKDYRIFLNPMCKVTAVQKNFPTTSEANL